ncbi:hypothetical protein GCM10009080_10080 [Cupriavidus pauculus]
MGKSKRGGKCKQGGGKGAQGHDRCGMNVQTRQSSVNRRASRAAWRRTVAYGAAYVGAMTGV